MRSMASNGNQDAAASMLKGHAKFAKGYVEESIGNGEFFFLLLIFTCPFSLLLFQRVTC